MSGPADAAYGRLRALLTAEELAPGERVGDERSLALGLGVTRSALRQALERLEAEGAVRRTIGRAGGVRVADGRIERHLNTTQGLPEIARRQGIHVETRVLSLALAVAGPRERRLLCLPEGAAVHRLLRLRSADGRPLSLESSRLPADLFPGLAQQDLSSLYRTLHEVYGIAPVYSDETLELVDADDHQATHLGVPVGTPMVRVQRSAAGSTGRPIEVAEELFIGERIRFHLRKYGYARGHERADATHTPTDAPAPVSDSGTGSDGPVLTMGEHR